ncbi:MAG: hypothetical protein RIT14_2714 [Pseudomonadota bacterium]
MTVVILTLLALLTAQAVYLAVAVARLPTTPDGFAGGGVGLPGWAVIFATGGIVLSGLDLPAHLALVGRFGLQANHLALGLIPAALAVILVQKRLWLAARITGADSPGEVLASYYGSVTLRIVMLTLALLFGLPFAAQLLGGAGDFLSAVTGGGLPRGVAIWTLAFALFLPAVIGGWRGVVLAVAVQSLLLAVLLVTSAGFAESVLPAAGFLTAGLSLPEGILADRLPGVIQYSAGIGKETVQGGIFTTVAQLSSALALVGLMLSPAVLYLGMTARAGRSLAFGTVWVVAGLVTGLMVLLAPLLAARMAGDAAGLAARLADTDLLAGATFALLLLAARLLAAGFFVAAGTFLVVRELVQPFILPELDARGARLAARIALAVAFLLVATLATFAPVGSAVFASLALPLSAQMFPALLGLAFVRWISRSAILTGLILGGLMVFFTEPPGLILFEGLFLNLPWGRWPLTIHSAGWGLALNLGAVLLVSIFTRKGDERGARDRLHDEFAARWKTDFGGRGARGAKWSLAFIWGFLALGPGAILGNTFFSQPIFTEGQAALGIPSLWVWQMLFWQLGVPLVWWLAYRSRLGITQADGLRSLRLSGMVHRARAPGWIAAGLSRVTER